MNLEQYRDKWLFEKVDEFVGFYPREFFVFDNFSSFGIIMDGEFYPTIEHAYQSGKFVDSAPQVADEIKNVYPLTRHKKLLMQTRISKLTTGMKLRLNIWKSC